MNKTKRHVDICDIRELHSWIYAMPENSKVIQIFQEVTTISQYHMEYRYIIIWEEVVHETI